jgi:glycosyltransferase involved in cell wall biosynthesis
LAAEHGVAIALGVRQDQPTYMRSRLTGVKRLLGVPYFDRLERRWRALAREHVAFTAGEELAAAYGGAPSAVSTAFTLVREAAVAAEPVETARGGALGAGQPVRLLSVGRLDPEKNPLLLPAIVERLVKEHADRDWRLTIVGDGPLEQQTKEHAEQLGVSDRIDFAGYIPYGAGLEDLYLQSDVFLHVSHTEGLPQVLIEAMAAGLPIVATDVGGVAAAVDPAGVPLVPPDDAGAAADALVLITADDELRHGVATRGLQRARALTIEAQQQAVVDRIAEEVQ